MIGVTSDETFAIALAVNDGYQAGVLAATRVGAFEEQQRIIKVIQKMQDTTSLVNTEQGKSNFWVLENVIQLIKGENK